MHGKAPFALLTIVSTLAGTVYAAPTPELPAQSTWTLTKTSTSAAGQVHVETSYLHLDTLNGKVLVQLDDGHGGFDHELTIGAVEYGYHALSKATLEHALRDPQLMAVEHEFEDDEQHAVFLQMVAAKQQLLDKVIGCKSQAVTQGAASHVFAAEPKLLSQADGKNTWELTFADGATVQYVEDAATKQALQIGDYEVASVVPEVDEAVFAVPDACLEQADVLSWNDNVHAAHELLKVRHNGDVSKSPALQTISWTNSNSSPQYRLKGTLWCGYTNEYDQHQDCSDCSRGCMADPFTYSGARVPYGSQIPASGSTVSNPNSNPDDIVRFQHVYPMSGTTFDNNQADINQIPVRLKSYRYQPNVNLIMDIKLPSSGTTAQKLTRCRAVPHHQLNIATTSPTDAAGGLEATLTYNGNESDDRICRQHDFCPLGVGSSILTCTCDFALFVHAKRGLPRALVGPDQVIHPCYNLQWKCKDWGVFSCKPASNGGGYRWEWAKAGRNKYSPGTKALSSLWSPIGRWDSQATICTALRSPKEGKNWIGGLRGDTGRPTSNVDLYSLQCGAGNACIHEHKIADGVCDDTAFGGVPYNLNTPDHGYDGGDCCAYTNPALTTDAYCKQPACKGLRSSTGFGTWSTCTASAGCGAKKTRTCVHPANSGLEFHYCFAEGADLSRNSAGRLVHTQQCTNSELPAGVAPCVWKTSASGACNNACNPSSEVVVGARFETRTCSAGTPGTPYSASQSCTDFGSLDTVPCSGDVSLCTWNTSGSGNAIWDTSQCINPTTGSKYQYCSKVPVTLVPASGIVNNDGSTAYAAATSSGAEAETLANFGYGSTWPTLPPTSSGSSSDVAIDAATQDSLNPNCVGATHLKDDTWLVKKAPCISK